MFFVFNQVLKHSLEELIQNMTHQVIQIIHSLRKSVFTKLLFVILFVILFVFLLFFYVLQILRFNNVTYLSRSSKFTLSIKLSDQTMWVKPFTPF